MKNNSTFLDMPLSQGMKNTIAAIGYTQATPIQVQSIPELLQGFDLLGQAQTGTGKTASFSIPLIELVTAEEHHVQALVVCPTRELCLQVCQEIKRLSAHKSQIGTVALYGGQAIEQQFRSLKVEQPQIVVATPGRLFDHLRRKSVELSRVRMIVLDEADEMLDMGFRPEIEQIFDMLPEENQRIFFSATMPKAIKDLACSYLRNPKIIKSEAQALTVNTITQSYCRARGREKVELMCRMLDYKDPKLAVVFCNAKSTADEIVDDINARGFEAGVLHGDLSQNQRDRVMAKFKSGLIKILVATDVAARGLDIDDVELVINFHLPHDPEDYVHRIGRTGRAGRTGYAISLVEPRDNSRLRRICQFAKIDIKEETPPSHAAVRTAKLNNLFAQVKSALLTKGIEEYKSFIEKQKMDAQDIAAGMFQLALKKFEERAITEDTAFESLRDRKYSGFNNNEPRSRGRSERPDFRRDRDSRDGGYRGGRDDRSRDFSSRSKEGRDFSPRGGRDFSDRGPRRESSFRSDGPKREPSFRSDGPRFSDDRKPRTEKRGPTFERGGDRDGGGMRFAAKAPFKKRDSETGRFEPRKDSGSRDRPAFGKSQKFSSFGGKKKKDGRRG